MYYRYGLNYTKGARYYEVFIQGIFAKFISAD